MEPESLYNLLRLPKAVGRPAEEELPQGAGPKWGWGSGQGGGAGLRAGPGPALLPRLLTEHPICAAPAYAFCFILDNSHPRLWKLWQVHPKPS